MDVVVAVLFLLLALGTLVLSRWVRQRTGLPRGRVIYADTSAWQRNEQALFSASHNITGKPDYLVHENNSIVPVEVKSSLAPAAPREGHILQLAAYCLLVEENWAIRPVYGIIKYSDRQFAIDYTDDLKAELLRVVAEMRAGAREPAGPHRSHSDARRCTTCGVRAACDERLVTGHQFTAVDNDV
ncbi:MAG: CRISPR-associated protein Cas4 [Chloroflexi bacterium]|nr:CRISPR-associated protein Cas4 [Chloroflexota bacterium]